MFRNPFSFEGRIRRLEYGLTVVLLYASLIGASVVMDLNENVTGPLGYAAPVLLILALIVVFWLFFAQSAKRCHDRGNSGWFQLIPFYRWILLFGESDFGHNRFGPNPKNEGNDIRFGFESVPVEHPAEMPGY